MLFVHSIQGISVYRYIGFITDTPVYRYTDIPIRPLRKIHISAILIGFVRSRTDTQTPTSYVH
jgi:hypothetical protein